MNFCRLGSRLLDEIGRATPPVSIHALFFADPARFDAACGFLVSAAMLARSASIRLMTLRGAATPSLPLGGVCPACLFFNSSTSAVSSDPRIYRNRPPCCRGCARRAFSPGIFTPTQDERVRNALAAR